MVRNRGRDTPSRHRASQRVGMIGTRSAISIRARGHRPQSEAVYMTAPDAFAAPQKALAERGPSIHDSRPIDMTEIWPWLALAGLGACHGLNPGMGWLFAVALGMHRHDGRIVRLSVVPIAFGHALSVALVAAAFLWAGLLIDARILRIACGAILIGWAFYHWRYGHRHRVRFGMQ